MIDETPATSSPATSRSRMPARHPFLLVNSGSGGGRTQDAIVAVAVELCLDHHVVRPGDDFQVVLTAALDRGADLLAAAGGDGTLCAVAGVAMDHDLAMVVVPAGTRNHFALDVGLDLEHPADVLRASLTAGHERRVDVGTINGSTFLNNASLGLYATAERRPDYRRHKVAAFVDAARESMSRDAGGQALLTLSLPGSSLVDTGDASSAVMVVNNGYSPGFAPGKRLRPRLDSGLVWVYVGGGLDLDSSAVTALVHDAQSILSKSGLRAAAGVERVSIAADRPDVPIAVDGEDRPDLLAPFEIASRPHALRLLVPTDPGLRDVGVRLSW